MKIVITGGPSAGKTSLGQIVARQFCDQVYFVEEAASLLFRAGFPRKNEVEHKKHEQLAIYYVQRELEMIAELSPNNHALVCDRGSLDSVAYWPGDENLFLQAVGSSAEKEIARYDWVLHLGTSPSVGYQMNLLRTETNQEALQLDRKIHEAWRSHPQRFYIPGGAEFVPKINQAVTIIALILKGLSYQQIMQEVFMRPKDATLLNEIR